MKNLKIGFIGQGWIGKNYADDFENRGYEAVRYSNEKPYIKNKNKIKDCDIVFVAVPTPTTPEGFDDGIVRSVMKLIGKGKTVVIKSTIVPGTTESIQKENPDIFVLHSPEFLTESMVKHDVANPWHNLIGIPKQNGIYELKAAEVLAILPPARFITKICPAKETELFKYGRNCFFFTKVIFMNLFYDLALKNGCRWETLREIMAADPWIGEMHISPVHKSGRGAGGHCLIKDFAAFIDLYKKYVKNDKKGIEVLLANEAKNIELLVNSKKDLDLLNGVYGKKIKMKN